MDSNVKYSFLILVLLFSVASANSTLDNSWLETYTEDNASVARGLTVNSEGVFITGRSGSGSAQDILTLKYSRKGDLKWTRSFDRGDRDDPIDMESGPENNVYITARSSDGNLWDYLTLKYGPEGDLKWNRTENLESGAVDKPNAIAVDSNGNVYVSGSEGFAENFKYYTVNYRSDGKKQWRKIGVGGEDIDIGPQGNLYASRGSFDGPYKIIKYRPNGDQVWKKESSTPREENKAKYLDVGPNGNIYLTGLSTNRTISYDHYLIKYDSSSEEEWKKVFKATGEDKPESDWPNPVAVGPKGNVFVAGLSQPEGNNSEYIQKFDPEGNRIWNNSRKIAFMSLLTDLEISENQKIYTTGQRISNFRKNDDQITQGFYIAKYQQKSEKFFQNLFSFLNNLIP